MVINVGEALDPDTAEVLTVERQAAGDYADGIYQDGAISTFKTLGSAQQPTPQELLYLPSGERDKDIMKFYCEKNVRMASDRDNLKADVVLYQGNRFKVVQAQRWGIYGYTIAYGAREK